MDIIIPSCRNNESPWVPKHDHFQYKGFWGCFYMKGKGFPVFSWSSETLQAAMAG